MSDTLQLLEEWLMHSALAGGLVLLAGAVAMRLVGQPARRQRLGELALATSLIVAALCALPAWLPYSIPLWPAAAVDECVAAPEQLDVAAADTDGPLELSAVVDYELVFVPTTEDMPTSEPAEATALLTTSMMPPFEASASDPAGPDWSVLLAWLGRLYLVVVAILLVRFALAWVGLWRLWRASEPAPLRAPELLKELTHGWSWCPRLRVCRRLVSPVSFGLWHPTILVPPTFCRRGAEERLRWILAHELTHLERRDALSCLLAGLAQTLYFYLPWYWWLRRQVRLCQEFVADASAAALTSSVDYAQYLVSLSSLRRQRLPAGAGVTGVLGSSSDLFRRISMLLNASERVERRCPAWWSVAAASGFLAVAVLLSGVSLRAEAAPQDKEKAEKQKTIEVELKLDDVLKKARKGEKAEAIELELKLADHMKKAKKGEVCEECVICVQDGNAEQRKVIRLSPDMKADEVRAIISKAGGDKGVFIVTVGDDKKPAHKGEHIILLEDGKKTPHHAIRLQGQDKPFWVQEVIKNSGAGEDVFVVTLVEEDKKDTPKKEADKKDKVEKKDKIEWKFEGLKGEDIKQIQDAIKRAQEAAGKAGDAGLVDVKKQLEEAMKQLEKARKEMDAQMPEIKKQLELKKLEALKGLEGVKGLQGLEGLDKKGTWSFRPAIAGMKGGRLGLGVGQPSEALLAQLDLPKGQCLVIESVVPESAAAKAGIQAFDILVQFNGEAVPSEPGAFIKAVDAIKAGETVSAVVLRKGQKVAIKGITLPEKSTFKYEIKDGMKIEPHLFQTSVTPKTPATPKTPSTPVIKKVPETAQVWVDKGSKESQVITTTIRNDERFNTRHQEGSLIITITGSVADGKMKVSEIVVQDGGVEKKYDSASGLPEQYRDKVMSLLEMGQKGKIEVRSKSSSKDQD